MVSERSMLRRSVLARRLAGIAAVLVVLMPASLFGAITVSNVRASQRIDGSGKVDVYYDLSGAIETANVSLVFSPNNGGSFDVPTTGRVSGDVGSGVTNGSNKHIVWEAMYYQPGQIWPQTLAKVIATVEPVSLDLYGETLELVPLPRGSCQMGTTEAGWTSDLNDEQPVHGVNIDYDLYMGKYEITQAQWLAVMWDWPSTDPGQQPDANSGLGDDYPAYWIPWSSITDPSEGFLVYANDYLYGQTDLTLRLPSEAEWEYACRAGSTSQFCFGNSNCGPSDCSFACNLGDYAWFCGNNTPETNGSKPVGTRLPNAFGLCDMHGNVLEWCQDFYHSDYTGAPDNGDAWLTPESSYRVLRGGIWNGTNTNFGEPRHCSSTYRYSYAPSSIAASRYCGFRVVADVRGPAGTPEAVSAPFVVDTTADLQVTMSPTAVQASIGVPLGYTIYVDNLGTQTAPDVVVTHALPAGLEFVSVPTSCTMSVNTLTWSVGDLTTSVQASLSVSVKANSFVQTTVTATSDPYFWDPNPSNNTASMFVEVLQADLQVDMTPAEIHAGIGEPFETTISVVNLGPQSATNVLVTQTLLSGIDILSSAPQQGTCTASAGVLSWNVGSLAVGSTATLYVRAQGMTTTWGTVTISATTTSHDPVPANNAASIATTIGQAGLLVTASAPGVTGDVGVPYEYSLYIYNAGPQTAEAVILTHTFPSGLAILSYAPLRGTCSLAGNTLTWNVGTLEPVPGRPSGPDSLDQARLPIGSTGLSIVAKAVTCTTGTASATASSPVFDPEPSDNTTTIAMEFEGLCVADTETFSTDVTNPNVGGTTGWTPMSADQNGQATDYDAAHGALRVTIGSGTQPRMNGWVTGNSEWLPYGAVGSDHHVRGKFYVFRSGQADMNDFNQIPGMRFRLANRFAVNSMLEVFCHLQGDVMGTTVAKDLRPSEDPTSPSIYRVDLDPVDVPGLQATGEGVLRGFEAYCLESQENGAIELTESVIGTYAASWLPDTAGPEVLRSRVYTTSASDAGDLQVFNSLSDGPFVRKFLLPAPGILGSEVALDGSTDPQYSESTSGVTFDTTPVASNRAGIAAREFSELGANTERIRVDADRQYKLKFHVTSTTNANRNPQLRLRARSVKFMWSHKLEIGGSLGAGASNNTIAQQALPGVGCANPDQVTPGENGGWYTLLMNTPISPEIRDTQTSLTAQPGPGVDAPSMRDIKFGFDILDTLSGSVSSVQELGDFTLDRVEIREYGKVPD